MKAQIILTISLAIILFSCKKGDNEDCTEPTIIVNCVDPNEIDSTILCPDNYKPVCGCDGKTYGNGCDAERSGITSFVEGKCCD